MSNSKLPILDLSVITPKYANGNLYFEFHWIGLGQGYACDTFSSEAAAVQFAEDEGFTEAFRMPGVILLTKPA